MILIEIFLPLPKLAPQGPWSHFLNSKLELTVSAENSVTFPWVDRSGQNGVWMMKCWDYRIIHWGLGLQKMKSEWYSNTWDTCSTHKLAVGFESNSNHETASREQSGGQTIQSSLLIVLNNHGSIHVGPMGWIRGSDQKVFAPQLWMTFLQAPTPPYCFHIPEHAWISQ